MKNVVRVAVAVVVVVIILGIAALAMIDLPAPITHVTKVLPNASWQK